MGDIFFLETLRCLSQKAANYTSTSGFLVPECLSYLLIVF